MIRWYESFFAVASAPRLWFLVVLDRSRGRPSVTAEAASRAPAGDFVGRRVPAVAPGRRRRHRGLLPGRARRRPLPAARPRPRGPGGPGPPAGRRPQRRARPGPGRDRLQAGPGGGDGLVPGRPAGPGQRGRSRRGDPRAGRGRARRPGRVEVGSVSLPRVLVVDDHAMLREALVELFVHAGFDVAGEAADGADAVALAKQLEPDVVLMDMRLPVLGGLDATRLIKDACPATQVVLLSAFREPGPGAAGRGGRLLRLPGQGRPAGHHPPGPPPGGGLQPSPCSLRRVSARRRVAPARRRGSGRRRRPRPPAPAGPRAGAARPRLDDEFQPVAGAAGPAGCRRAAVDRQGEVDPAAAGVDPPGEAGVETGSRLRQPSR